MLKVLGALRNRKGSCESPSGFQGPSKEAETAKEAVRPPKVEAEESKGVQSKEAETTKNSADPQHQRSEQEGSNAAFTERSLEFMSLMMEFMKEMHKRLSETKEETGVIKGVEIVRSGSPDLPLLAPWEPQQGPLILRD